MTTRMIKAISSILLLSGGVNGVVFIKNDQVMMKGRLKMKLQALVDQACAKETSEDALIRIQGKKKRYNDGWEWRVQQEKPILVEKSVNNDVIRLIEEKVMKGYKHTDTQWEGVMRCPLDKKTKQKLDAAVESECDETQKGTCPEGPDSLNTSWSSENNVYLLLAFFAAVKVVISILRRYMSTDDVHRSD